MRLFIFNRRILFILALCASGFCFRGDASDIRLSAGPIFEYNLYGEPGIAARIGHAGILGGHPHLELSYTTSRLSFWNGPHALLTDNLFATVSWEFGPFRKAYPFAGIDIGYSRYDLDGEYYLPMIDNTAYRCNLRGGVRFFFDGLPVVPSLEGGLALITSSTVFPLFFRIGLAYVIAGGDRS